MESSSSISHQRLYELLGAPSLLYRHAPSYRNAIIASHETSGQKSVQQESRYIHKEYRAVNRVKTRWYYSVDHPFRLSYNEDPDIETRKRRRRRKETDENENQPNDPESKRRALLRALNRTDPFQQESALYSSSKDLEAARRSILPDDPDSKIRHLYDQSYVPGLVDSQSKTMTPRLPGTRVAMSRLMAKERMDADVSYLAPMDVGCIRYALEEENEDEGIRRKKPTRTPMEATYDHPSSYGNCLVCVPCPEYHNVPTSSKQDDSEKSSISQDQQSTGWCLIHPTGELLSRVCASNLVLPQGVENDGSSGSRRVQQNNKSELDVGEPIRQILQCGKWETRATFGNGDKNEAVGMFVARSPSYCTVFSIRQEPQNDQTATRTKASSNTFVKGHCMRQYILEEVARIDLRSPYASEPSYRPLDVASHPNYGNAYSDAKLAILSHCRNRDESNVLNHVIVRDPLVVQQHTIACLKSIAEIDFTNSHPMTLWAAARSYVRPALTRRFQHGRPLLGHGNSLYTIDLRSNNAVFQWSPSAEEMLPEGIHSVSGIRTDWQKEHAVWATSISAAKTWEIDGRMPCRAVNSWSLASACDDWGAVVPTTTGLHGAGTLLTQPVSMDNNSTRPYSPLLSVCKNPGSFGIHLYQRPNYLPRFHTNSLECATGFSSRHQEASVCTSSVFALPDVSDKTFSCGIAAIRTPISRVLQNVKRLGYDRDPTNALCVLTMTNKGDMYGHTLLECHPEAEQKSHHFADLPLGCAAVPIPKADQDEDQNATPGLDRKNDGNIRVRLSNTFPFSSDAIVPHTVMDRSDCLPFTTIRMEQLPTYENNGANIKAEVENSEKSHVPAVSGKTSVQHPTCDSGLGSVMTSSNQGETAKGTIRSKVKLAPQHIVAAHESLESFGDCFHSGRKSVVEEINGSHEEPKTRSDVTKQVLAATEMLWNDHDKINEYVTVKKEEGYETDEEEGLSSFNI